MLSFVDPLEQNLLDLYPLACQLLDEMVNRGCAPAKFRKSEIELLHGMIGSWDGDKCAASSTGALELTATQNTPLLGVRFPQTSPTTEEPGVRFDLSPEQMLSLAEMVDVQEDHLQDDVSWMNDWLWD